MSRLDELTTSGAVGPYEVPLGAVPQGQLAQKRKKKRMRISTCSALKEIDAVEDDKLLAENREGRKWLRLGGCILLHEGLTLDALTGIGLWLRDHGIGKPLSLAEGELLDDLLGFDAADRMVLRKLKLLIEEGLENYQFTPEQLKTFMSHLYLVDSVLSAVPFRQQADTDFDEFASAGSDGLASAVKTFDPSLHIPFEGWAVTLIRRAIFKRIRMQSRYTKAVNQLADITKRALASRFTVTDVEPPEGWEFRGEGWD